MVKIRIRDLARSGEKAVGVFRYFDDADALLGEYPFEVRISDVLGRTTEQVQQYAVNLVENQLKAEKLERDWAEVQRILEPLVDKVA